MIFLELVSCAAVTLTLGVAETGPSPLEEWPKRDEATKAVPQYYRAFGINDQSKVK